jgi:hypothetical protein
MILAWLYKIISPILVPLLAALCIMFLTLSVVQTIRISGISVFGLHIVDGLETQLAHRQAAIVQLQSNLATCHSNTKKLQAALNDQSALIVRWKQKADAVQKAAQHSIDLASGKLHTAEHASAGFLAQKRHINETRCQAALRYVREVIQ